MNSFLLPSVLEVKLVSDATWWDSPVLSVMAGLLGTLLGALITYRVASLSERAQDRRQSRDKVFSAFMEITDAYNHFIGLAQSSEGHGKHGSESRTRIEAMRPVVAAATLRMRLYDRALKGAADSYAKQLDAVEGTMTPDDWNTKLAVLEEAYAKLEKKVATRVGV